MEGVAIITGGGTGIGRASADALSSHGWSVVVTGRREPALADTVAQLDGPGLAVAADVSQPDDVDRLFSEAAQRFGRVDLLFNNAGIGAPPVPVDELTVEQWRAVVDVNLTGAFLCARAAFARMRNQDPAGGRIINNGSVSATTPRPFSAPYTATKHAITGLTKSTSLDCRKYDIACGQIDIGNAATEMTERMKEGVPQADGTTKVEPRMDVDDVGRAVAFMAGLPPDSNVQTMTIMATQMPFVGRG